MIRTVTLLALAASLAPFTAAAVPVDRVLRADLIVLGPIEEVWKAWTTEEGIKSFFAPAGQVDLKVDGTYDIWFNPDGKPGERGAEGMRILGVELEKRFVFTWNAPPTIPTIRGQRTIVILDFTASTRTQTRVRFTQMGWGEGTDWDAAYSYFDRAWGAVVLPRLLYRFEQGPIDWKSPPQLKSIGSMAATLGRRSQ